MTSTLGAAGAMLICLMGCSSPARAQDVSSTTRDIPRQSSDHILVGLGVVAMPTYQGSDDYRVLPIPMVDIVSGPFFANLRNGVGVNVIETRSFTLGGSVAMMPGYRRRDVPQGIGRVTVGAGGRLFATVKAGGAILSVGGAQGFVGSTQGVIADASIAYPIMASERLIVIPSMGTSWADEKHNGRYFGISRSEAIASGLPGYRLGDGFKDFTVGLTTSYRLSQRISIIASTNVSTLVGDVKNSPLVKKRTQATSFLSVDYLIGK
ncbi:MAG TPA: MipA/OmpV family protein [Sphingobium sp.]|uniref:MipA/OmpV family protein n=1 Tax=Sphingobium sp. TaxID=1912891 RepID=UPI002ED5170E